jgi:hypothetical protein
MKLLEPVNNQFLISVISNCHYRNHDDAIAIVKMLIDKGISNDASEDDIELVDNLDERLYDDKAQQKVIESRNKNVVYL